MINAAYQVKSTLFVILSLLDLWLKRFQVEARKRNPIMASRPPKRKRLSPREKKNLSLSKDRRADWWEYDRKKVRSKHRAVSHRVARREAMRNLIYDPDAAEARFILKQRKRWKKAPGMTLSDYITNRRTQRKAMYRARILRALRASESDL